MGTDDNLLHAFPVFRAVEQSYFGVFVTANYQNILGEAANLIEKTPRTTMPEALIRRTKSCQETNRSI